jgi:hypothetical protein
MFRLPLEEVKILHSAHRITILSFSVHLGVLLELALQIVLTCYFITQRNIIIVESSDLASAELSLLKEHCRLRFLKSSRQMNFRRT